MTKKRKKGSSHTSRHRRAEPWRRGLDTQIERISEIIGSPIEATGESWEEDGEISDDALEVADPDQLQVRLNGAVGKLMKWAASEYAKATNDRDGFQKYSAVLSSQVADAISSCDDALSEYCEVQHDIREEADEQGSWTSIAEAFIKSQINPVNQ